MAHYNLISTLKMFADNRYADIGKKCRYADIADADINIGTSLKIRQVGSNQRQVASLTFYTVLGTTTRHTFGVQNPTLRGTLLGNPTLCGTEVGLNGTLAVLAYMLCRQWESGVPPSPG